MIWASVGPLIITTNAKFIMNLCTILGTKHNRLYSTLQKFGNFWNKASTNKLCRAKFILSKRELFFFLHLSKGDFKAKYDRPRCLWSVSFTRNEPQLALQLVKVCDT